MNWSFGDDPTSSLAKKIIHNYYNDRSLVVIVHGDPRIGKSGYAFKAVVQAFNFLFGWEDLRRIYDNTMGYDPLDVISKWRRVLRPTHPDPKFRTNKLPAFIWDDGGVYLFNQDYNKPTVKNVMKYFQIVFTKVQVIIITTPTPKVITAGLRAMPSAVWLKVMRSRGTDKILAELPNAERYSRYARLYQPFMSPDLKTLRVWRDFHEKFDCRFPNDIYDRYQPEREGYLTELEDTIELELRADVRKKRDMQQKRIDALNKVEPEV